jgi:chitinase
MPFMARPYVVDIAGGTATATVQIQQKQTLKSFFVSWANAAAGKIELSYSSTSQIGTAQPDTNVIARVSCNAGTNESAATIPINMPVTPFQSIYLHCTGAGNLGTAVLS